MSERNRLDELNQKRAAAGRPNRVQAYNELAGLLNEGIALTSAELQALLVKNGYSPRTIVTDALGFKRGSSAFSKITGTPIDSQTYMRRRIFFNPDMPEEDNGVAEAERRVKRAKGQVVDEDKTIEETLNKIIRETR